jgi:lipopolysaccharide transport protein LptA
VGNFAGGALSRLEAVGSPRLVERAPAPGGAPARAGGKPEPPLRELRSERLTADFAAAGGLRTATADGAVEYRAGPTAVDAVRMTYDAATGKGEAFGQPVEMVSERGTLHAPHATWDETAGILAADGGVTAVLDESDTAALDGSPLGSGEGPVRVESHEALWRDEPRSFLFRGAVRAWQGDNLVLAQALRGDRTAEGTDVLTATGEVKTVWIPASEADGAGGSGGPEASAGGAPQEPVEVTAQEMVYRAGERTLVYRGKAVAVQGRRELACQELLVALDGDGRAESMTCTGQVVLDDRAAGNRATGQRAVYDLGARTVTIEGAPVRLRKADGAQVEGRRVVYDIEAGSATVRGEAPAPPAAPAAPEVGGEG